MKTCYELMRIWQREHDEIVRITDPQQKKYYLTFDSASYQFLIETARSYIHLGFVYFSSKEKAQNFIDECGEELIRRFKLQQQKQLNDTSFLN